jgi:hypothetical protein
MVRPCVARGFVDLGGFAVLHQCIRRLIGAVCAPGHHGYQRACVLITGQASSGAIWVTGVRMRPEDRSSISFHPLADLGRKTGLCHRSLLDRCSSFVRAVRPFLRSLIAATNASAFFLAFLFRRLSFVRPRRRLSSAPSDGAVRRWLSARECTAPAASAQSRKLEI